MEQQRDSEHLASGLRIVLLYAVFAGLWIYFSDTLLGALVRNPQAYVRLSVTKGFLFIAVTGTFLYFLISRRIRRLRAVAAALADSQTRFRSYVENAPTAIMVFDSEDRCVDHNQAAVALIGAGADTLERQRLEEILPGVPLRARPDGEFESRRRDGAKIWVQVRSVEMSSGTFLLFCQEVTERVRAEEELRETHERLLQAAKMEAVGRLAGGVAHDFNNILMAIYGYSDVLLDALPPGQEAHGQVSEIRKAAARAAALTQQLLAFSRRQALVPRTVDFNALLLGLRPMLTRLIGEDVEVVLDLGQGLWSVRADPARLEQALLNLAVNARDAMPQGGRLTLRTRNAVLEPGTADARSDGHGGDHVTVTVTDTGVGMDTETQSHLFEPFFTTKDVGKGTGLGLATVYGIVSQSGGSITFRSERGSGTSFVLTFPRSPEEARAREESRLAPATASGRETVLYVEDDEAVRRLVTLVLERRGYEVLAAGDGMEALAIAEQAMDRISLVIADVVMPRMNGRELVDRLRGMHSGLKFAFTSGYTDDIVERHDVIESGGAFIEKPIDAESLLRKVREILDSK